MDPRTRRSRDRLHAAALALAEDRAISALAVTEIARAAGVHRSTFYEHATSPAELVQAALVEELDALREALLVTDDDAAAALTAVTVGVLGHIRTHAGIYRRELSEGNALASMLSGHFRATTLQLLARGRVTIDVSVPGVSPADVADAAARFLANGTVGIIEGWLTAPDPQIDAFLRVYDALLPQWWPHTSGV